MHNNLYANNQKNVFVLILTTLILIVFSPPLAYIAMIILLLFLKVEISKSNRILIAFIATLSLAIIVASRHKFYIETDDFNRYYLLYTDLFSGNYSAIFRYGHGMEIGLPIFYILVGIVSHSANPSFIMFSTSFTMLFLLVCWNETYFTKNMNAYQKSQSLALILIFYAIYDSTQMIRQAFSMVILLYAISEERILYKSIFLILASSFHLTAPIVFILIEFTKKRPKLTFFLVLFSSISFVALYNSILDYYQQHNYNLIFGSKFKGAHEKIKYVYNSSATTIVQDIRFYLIFLFFLINKKNHFDNKWKDIFIIFLLLYIIAHFLPISPFRAALLFTAILPGAMYYISFPYNKKIFLWFAITFLIHSILSMLNYDLYFCSYGWIGYPFFYLK